MEFALVAPLLFVLLFGIMAYGIYFTDDLALHDGVRAAARNGSLLQPGPASAPVTCPGGWTYDTGASGGQAVNIRNVACTALAQMGLIGGKSAIKVEVHGGPPGAWTANATDYIQVCGEVTQSIVLPFIPLPDGGFKRVSVRMPIEQTDTGDTSYYGGYTAPLPGDNWSWC